MIRVGSFHKLKDKDGRYIIAEQTYPIFLSLPLAPTCLENLCIKLKMENVNHINVAKNGVFSFFFT